MPLYHRFYCDLDVVVIILDEYDVIFAEDYIAQYFFAAKLLNQFRCRLETLIRLDGNNKIINTNEM